jgi:hypothetical protein
VDEEGFRPIKFVNRENSKAINNQRQQSGKFSQSSRSASFQIQPEELIQKILEKETTARICCRIEGFEQEDHS